MSCNQSVYFVFQPGNAGVYIDEEPLSIRVTWKHSCCAVPVREVSGCSLHLSSEHDGRLTDRHPVSRPTFIGLPLGSHLAESAACSKYTRFWIPNVSFANQPMLYSRCRVAASWLRECCQCVEAHSSVIVAFCGALSYWRAVDEGASWEFAAALIVDGRYFLLTGLDHRCIWICEANLIWLILFSKHFEIGPIALITHFGCALRLIKYLTCLSFYLFEAWQAKHK